MDVLKSPFQSLTNRLGINLRIGPVLHGESCFRLKPCLLLLIESRLPRSPVLGEKESLGLSYRGERYPVVRSVDDEDGTRISVELSQIMRLQVGGDKPVPNEGEKGPRVACTRKLSIIVDDFNSTVLPMESHVLRKTAIAEGCGKARRHRNH